MTRDVMHPPRNAKTRVWPWISMRKITACLAFVLLALGVAAGIRFDMSDRAA
jgi:hypothetical protein